MTIEEFAEFLSEADLACEIFLRVSPKPWVVRVYAVDDPEEIANGSGDTLEAALVDAVHWWRAVDDVPSEVPS